jgi:surface antigen
MLWPMKALKSPLAKQLLANRIASAQLRRYVARAASEATGPQPQTPATTLEWQDGARTVRYQVTRVPKAG